jgi:hypothetical protein
VRINTGRAVDIEWTAHGGLRVLSASGGLWVNDCEMPCSTSTGEPIYNWVPISDQLNTLRGGAFATHPTDPNTIILGTGEAYIGAGTGVYRTMDRGQSWESIGLPQYNKEFYNVIFDPEDPSVVHLSGNEGYYRSDDGGSSFTRRMVGVITDLVLNPQRTATLYAVRQGVGYHRSYDKGITWQLITAAPNANLGRSELDICPSGHIGAHHHRHHQCGRILWPQVDIPHHGCRPVRGTRVPWDMVAAPRHRSATISMTGRRGTTMPSAYRPMTAGCLWAVACP